VAVAAAMCTMLFATCLTAAEATGRSKSCCAAMQRGCDNATVESSCCVVPSGTDPATLSSQTVDHRDPMVMAASTLRRGIDPAPVHRHPSGTAHASPGPPGVPTYLFVSTFRI